MLLLNAIGVKITGGKWSKASFCPPGGRSYKSVTSRENYQLKLLLAKLGMDPKSTTGIAHTSRLCHSLPRTNVFAIPQSPNFTEVFSQAFKSTHSTRLDRVSRLLAAIKDLGPIGLGLMPPIEPAVASLIVPPDEALRQDLRCPNMECRRMDNLIGKIYNSMACLGRTVNMLAHLLLAINASLCSPDTTAT